MFSVTMKQSGTKSSFFSRQPSGAKAALVLPSESRNFSVNLRPNSFQSCAAEGGGELNSGPN